MPILVSKMGENHNKFNDSKIIVQFEKEDVQTISTWKKLVFQKYGWGGQRERLLKLIKEDLKSLDVSKIEAELKKW